MVPPFANQDDPTLHLNVEQFAATLHALAAAPDNTVLRQQVALVQQHLADPAHPLRTADGPTTRYNHAALVADLDQIATAHTLQRARYYIERLVRGLTVVRTNKVNDINLNRWKEYEDLYTDSLWLVPRRDSSGVHAAGYWGNFIPQIPHQMIRRYTKPGDWVLDTFAGSGTTLIEGQRLGRNTLGVELQPHMVDYARQAVSAEPNEHSVQTVVVQGDSTTFDFTQTVAAHGCPDAQLVLLHPPYFDIITFSDDPRDLSRATTADDFLRLMGQIVDNVLPVLRRRGYVVLVIGDKYTNGEWIPLGFQTMNVVLQRGLTLKSIIVKNFDQTTAKRNQQELWRYRALVGGFYVFKHEYIFVFRTP